MIQAHALRSKKDPCGPWLELPSGMDRSSPWSNSHGTDITRMGEEILWIIHRLCENCHLEIFRVDLFIEPQWFSIFMLNYLVNYPPFVRNGRFSTKSGGKKFGIVRWSYPPVIMVMVTFQCGHRTWNSTKVRKESPVLLRSWGVISPDPWFVHSA